MPAPGSAEHKAGFVAILGDPNAGKSTLVNALVGRKIAGVSPKPQTTRRRILAVWRDQGYQIAFIDTPGFAPSRNLLGRMMARSAISSAREADLLVYVLDSVRPEESEGMKRLLGRTEKPKLLVLSKIDLVQKQTLLPLIERFSATGVFREIIPVSALKRDGLDRLLFTIKSVLPAAPPWFEETSESFLDDAIVQEIVQEKIFRGLREEVPYGCAVRVEEIAYEKRLIRIRAVIVTERESHKPIIIGERGRALKKIGMEARKDLEGIAGSKIHLELWVKVDKGWRDHENRLSELGFTRSDGLSPQEKRGKIS